MPPRPYRPSPLRQSTTPLVPLVPQFNRMPPKRRSRAPPPRFPAPSEQQPPPPSSLAKQHRISASTEASISAAFDLFATTSTSSSLSTLPTPSLRRALTALSAPARTRADLQDLIAAADPLSTGKISYENFVAVAALQLSVVDTEEDEAEAEADEGDEAEYNDDGYAMSRRRDSGYEDTRRSKSKGQTKSTTRSHSGREIDEAFRLFVGGGAGGGDEVITIGALRRVARELKEDVAEGVLKDMILEANGGAGVGKGVRRGEFEAVMRRAGVFQ